jgi:hypothetical protein
MLTPLGSVVVVLALLVGTTVLLPLLELAGLLKVVGAEVPGVD